MIQYLLVILSQQGLCLIVLLKHLQGEELVGTYYLKVYLIKVSESLEYQQKVFLK